MPVESNTNSQVPSTNLVSAAEYVRMSTEQQQYSTANQSQAIREYASRHGFRIDKTYEDIRMNQMNSAVLDYYLLPRFEMEADQVALAENNGLALDAYRFDTLDMLFELAARSQLMEVSYGIGSMHCNHSGRIN